MYGQHCSKCGKGISGRKFIRVPSRSGGLIYYCSEPCFVKHNHRHHSVNQKIKQLQKQNKYYLSTLKGYGYGQS